MPLLALFLVFLLTQFVKSLNECLCYGQIMISGILCYICMLPFCEADKNALTSRIFQPWFACSRHPPSPAFHNLNNIIPFVYQKVNNFLIYNNLFPLSCLNLHTKRFQIFFKNLYAYKSNTVNFIYRMCFLRQLHKTVLAHGVPLCSFVISDEIFLFNFCFHFPPLS